MRDVAQESAADVVADLRSALNDAVAAHTFACTGLGLIPDFLERVPRTPENPDPTIFIGNEDPNLPTARHYAFWRRSKALSQVARDGPVEILLSRQWIVYMFHRWEDEFRPRLAAAHRCAAKDLTYPLLGDLRRLRNDVIHHRGIATEKNSGHCEVLSHWFESGDRIHLRGEHFSDFVQRFPWEALEGGPVPG